MTSSLSPHTCPTSHAFARYSCSMPKYVDMGVRGFWGGNGKRQNDVSSCFYTQLYIHIHRVTVQRYRGGIMYSINPSRLKWNVQGRRRGIACRIVTISAHLLLSILASPFRVFGLGFVTLAYARLGHPSSRLPHARPSSQSVTLTTLGVCFSHSPFSSTCSIVCLMILPSSSNSNRNSPENLCLACLSPLRPMMLVIFSTASLTGPASRSSDLPHVSHLTMSLSWPASPPPHAPFFTMRSDKIFSLQSPTTGTRPHATGAVHKAAVYASLPLTVGRLGCVEGNSSRLICGERIS